MRNLALALRDLCLFRVRPQDLPWAPTLLTTLLAASIIVDAVTGALLGKPGMALAASLIGFAVLLGGLWVLLQLAGKRERFVQAALALVGASLVFGLLAVPVQLLLGELPEDLADLAEAQTFGMLLLAGLGMWSLAVMAHILRHTLEKSFFGGLLLALMLNLVVAACVSLLMVPVPQP